MTSGVFHIRPLAEITINRPARQRRELLNIDILADSIRRLGLIHPLVVTREGELVAGERRHAALTQLGWVSVPVQYTDELDPDRLYAIELEENIKRLDISWQDQVNAVLKYHELRKREVPNWRQEDTAAAIGLTQAHVSRLLTVGDELVANPTLAEAPKLSTAHGIVQRANERRDQQAIERLHGALPGGAPAPLPESILTTDFTEWVQRHDLVVPRFNFIHCDFPYGIGADTFNQGAAPAHGGYDDTPEVWENLMTALSIVTQRLTSESAHLMFWFAMRKGDQRLYETTARSLERAGWEVNPFPLVWMKSDGMGIIPDPQRGPRQIYETCFLGSKGDRKIVRAVANAYACPTARDQHMSEKPEPMLRHFFGMLVDSNTVMLDPTCGSGSALRAAESLGAKYVLGLEQNEEFAERARGSLRTARILRETSHDPVPHHEG